MYRLRGFDYKRPYFYMVTLKRLPKLAAFSWIAREAEPPKDAKGRVCYLRENEITRAFNRVIKDFAGKWWGLWPIECFTVMPDHIHLLIRIKDTGNQMALGKYVYQIEKALAREYWRVVSGGDAGGIPPMERREQDAGWQRGQGAGAGDFSAGCAVGKARRVAGAVPSAPIFKTCWHDWIVKKDGQLAAFTRYIRENPMRAWLRSVNRRYFGKVCKVAFLGREWFAYGNLAILELPVLMAVKGSRATRKGSAEWNALVESCARLGPGGAGVGTFMSPLEKECGNAIAAAGGKWVVLSPDGFHERWHPPREKERYCAEGRMLFLSLYSAMDRRPTRQELYGRCHEMGEIAVNGLESTCEK